MPSHNPSTARKVSTSSTGDLPTAKTPWAKDAATGGWREGRRGAPLRPRREPHIEAGRAGSADVFFLGSDRTAEDVARREVGGDVAGLPDPDAGAVPAPSAR
jgi:hypothetical protein